MSVEHPTGAFIPGPTSGLKGRLGCSGEGGSVGTRVEGKEQAFREATLACLDGLFGFAMALARDPAVAEDLVQETYLRALSARHKADPSENVRGWLFTILHNAWRNQVRRPSPEPLDDEPEEPRRVASVVWLAPPPDPEAELERSRLRQSMGQAIEALPGRFREVVVLRCLEGFSYQEIAGILGCPTGTVMSRLARGRAILRESLGGQRIRSAREASR